MEKNYSKKIRSLIILLLVCAIIMGGTFYFSRNYLVVFPISGASMEDTVFDKEYVLLFRTQKPKYDDIVVFWNEQENCYLVKRVIGLAGDVIETEFSEADGYYHVYRNGEMVNEDHIKEPMNSFYGTRSVTVPDGKFFFLGDNRNYSLDSHIGLMGEINEIQGVALLKYTNWKDIHLLKQSI